MLKEGYHSYMAMSIIFLPILQFFHTFPFPKGEVNKARLQAAPKGPSLPGEGLEEA
jgi:hypothetical protein